jgi:nitroimidazol reductase NimA-like FMN-containing flavoprotein (pyridoxamine 5'-phosphate oxidase superfamily)
MIEPGMSKPTPFKKLIGDALQSTKFAVLATEGNGQPHASLIALTPVEGFHQLIFATYRNTRKYTNLKNNSKVAILIENSFNFSSQLDITVLTAFGHAEEVDANGSEAATNAHLLKHPDQEQFLFSADCAIFMVNVENYQLVRGIDDVIWLSIDDFSF